MNFIALVISSMFFYLFSLFILASQVLWVALRCSLRIRGNKDITLLICLWSFPVLLVRVLYIVFDCIRLLALLVLALCLCLLLWLLIFRIFPYF